MFSDLVEKQAGQYTHLPGLPAENQAGQYTHLPGLPAVTPSPPSPYCSLEVEEPVIGVHKKRSACNSEKYFRKFFLEQLTKY